MMLVRWGFLFLYINVLKLLAILDKIHSDSAFSGSPASSLKFAFPLLNLFLMAFFDILENIDRRSEDFFSP